MSAACVIEGCTSPVRSSKGYCAAHAQRVKRHGDPHHLKHVPNKGLICASQGCQRDAYCKKLCVMHYARLIEHGDPAVKLKQGRRANPDYRYVTDRGYVMLFRDGATIAEHRHVMQSYLGRTMLAGETVHHINGVRDDNRLENLELWTRPQPYGVRVADEVRRARELLRLYGDLFPDQEV